MWTFKDIVKACLRSFDVGITKFSTLQRLREDARAAHDIKLLQALPKEHVAELLKYLSKSKSQFRQDLFVLSHLNFKKNGFFVEFGATNGVDLSNTYLLESEFGWTGILAEPARCWHDALRRNRKAYVETRCVWKESEATLTFNEVAAAELSTIKTYSSSDLHGEARSRGRTYEVKTISLTDLLSTYNAPERIDYLSIDTEGSEFEILEAFDFGRYSFEVITCEHNFNPMRERIFELLSRNGYIRKYQEISVVDDWYVRAESPASA